MDVGEILVGSRRPIEVPLVNKSPCSVSFYLSIQQTILDEDPDISEPVPIGTLFYDLANHSLHTVWRIYGVLG